jgi:hypothetical protein
MWLREDKTLETALRFVGLTVGLCAIPALITRSINAVRVAGMGGTTATTRLFWLQASGLVFSLTLLGSAAVLLWRTSWFLGLLGSSTRRELILLGDQRFWMSCVRAVGVSSILFGAAWFGHAVFRYKGALPLPIGDELTPIRWTFVGAVFSIVSGLCLSMVPYSLATFFQGSTVVSSDRPVVSDRRLLENALWASGIFALSFRGMWIARHVTWVMEGPEPWTQLRSLIGEVVGCCCCFWVIRKRVCLASKIQPFRFCCPTCNIGQHQESNCPECGKGMLRNFDRRRGVSVISKSWQRAWVRLASLAVLGWIAPVAASRGSVMMAMVTGRYLGRPEDWIWSFVMGAGAPVLVAAALVLFGAPWNGTLATQNDTLRAVALRVTGLTMLMQTAYLSCLLFGYLLRAKSTVLNYRFYPSGLVASVQCIAAIVIVLWLFWQSAQRRD